MLEFKKKSTPNVKSLPSIPPIDEHKKRVVKKSKRIKRLIEYKGTLTKLGKWALGCLGAILAKLLADLLKKLLGL